MTDTTTTTTTTGPAPIDPAVWASLIFTWAFPQLECAPTEDGLTDVVKIVHWRLRGEDAQGFAAERYGSLALDAADPANFHTFASLTAAIVQGWAEASLKLDELKAGIAAEISVVRNPPRVVRTLPA